VHGPKTCGQNLNVGMRERTPASPWIGCVSADSILRVVTSRPSSKRLYRSRKDMSRPRWLGWVAQRSQTTSERWSGRPNFGQISAPPAGKVRRVHQPVRISASLNHRYHYGWGYGRRNGKLLPRSLDRASAVLVHLHAVRQQPGETLRAFIFRFTKVRGSILRISDAFIITAFRQGVRDEKMLEKLATHQVETVTTLFALADKCNRAAEGRAWHSAPQRGPT
jgi:hypothetical protein